MATRTIANGGGNYNSTGTWVEGAVPTSADDVVATATSGALTVTAAAAAKTLILTGYTNTLTINSGQTLTVSGDVTLASGMTYAGAGTLAVAATATLTANGIAASGILVLTGAITVTLADNWIVAGTFSLPATGLSVAMNGNQLTCNAGWSCLARLSGTTVILLAGTGTWTGGGNGRYCSCPITINTPGTLTIDSSNGPSLGANTLTYVAGAFAGTGSWLIGANYTISGALPAIANLSFNAGNVTLAINNVLTVTNVLSAVRQSNQSTLTLSGADVAIGALLLHATYNLAIQSGRTLTVGTALYATGNLLEATQTIRAVTASSAFTLTYNGTQANMQLAYVIFTDVTATNPLWNHWGGTLTRTSGITNTSYTPGDYSDPGEAQVATGTSYLYRGTTKNGSYAAAGGGLLTHPGMSGGMRG